MSSAAPEHPNRPARGILILAFVGILLAGVLGGAIGWGIVDASCTETPAVGDQLVDSVPGTSRSTQSCDGALLAGALGGAALAAVGAGVVVALMLRAQSEWRAHPPRDTAAGARDRRVSRSAAGGSPPRT